MTVLSNLKQINSIDPSSFSEALMAEFNQLVLGTFSLSINLQGTSYRYTFQASMLTDMALWHFLHDDGGLIFEVPKEDRNINVSITSNSSQIDVSKQFNRIDMRVWHALGYEGNSMHFLFLNDPIIASPTFMTWKKEVPVEYSHPSYDSILTGKTSHFPQHMLRGKEEGDIDGEEDVEATYMSSSFSGPEALTCHNRYLSHGHEGSFELKGQQISHDIEDYFLVPNWTLHLEPRRFLDGFVDPFMREKNTRGESYLFFKILLSTTDLPKQWKLESLLTYNYVELYGLLNCKGARFKLSEAMFFIPCHKSTGLLRGVLRSKVKHWDHTFPQAEFATNGFLHG
jgi:hypothetical protein